MRLLRYGAPGREKPGLADKDGNVRDLSKVIAQIDDTLLAPRNLARLARVKPETLPIVRGSPRLGVPYAGISKFIAVGLNYSDHAAESGMIDRTSTDSAPWMVIASDDKLFARVEALERLCERIEASLR